MARNKPVIRKERAIISPKPRIKISKDEAEVLEKMQAADLRITVQGLSEGSYVKLMSLENGGQYDISMGLTLCGEDYFRLRKLELAEGGDVEVEFKDSKLVQQIFDWAWPELKKAVSKKVALAEGRYNKNRFFQLTPLEAASIEEGNDVRMCCG
jgi:hypothetical protein